MEMQNNCRLCPRDCNVNRYEKMGVCGVSNTVKIARAALHFWEEPCISGQNGSGAVFFSGCPLHCVFCQNEKISHGQVGREISIEELARIFICLQEYGYLNNKLPDQEQNGLCDNRKCGANNINLVTGTHFIPQIVQAVKMAKRGIQIEEAGPIINLHVPIIYNTSGYETVESLKLLDGVVDVYLPDYKYMDTELSSKYSHAKDYSDIAKAAIEEMVRQCPKPVFDDNGFIIKGVIVRQLLLPGHVNDAKAIVKYLYDTYKEQIYISMMSQYTPMPQIKDEFPELNRRVTKREYNSIVQYALDLGIENAFIQDRHVAKESFIPEFTN